MTDTNALAANYAPRLIFTRPETGEKRLYAKDVIADRATTRHESNAVDSKGRRIGVLVAIHSTTYSAPAEGEECYGLVDLEIGYSTRWFVRIQKTKNGQPFGATQPSSMFETREAAESFAAREVAERVAKYEAEAH